MNAGIKYDFAWTTSSFEEYRGNALVLCVHGCTDYRCST